MHVWRADLAVVSPELGELLCEAEQVRAARIVDRSHGELWRRSRGLLRTLLGRYVQLEPSSLRFGTGEHGKPQLAVDGTMPSSSREPPAARPDAVAFNMSHSDGLALYAFSRAGAVGVDVEFASRPIDAVAIASRMLGREQAQHLQALDPAMRQREFLRVWVRYEARLKCVGVGIGAGSASALDFSSWDWEIDLGEDAGAAAAVAAARAPGELKLWEWRG